MTKFQVVFHIDEVNQAGAEEWAQRAFKILQENSDLLRSPTTGAGTFCSGHVLPDQTTSTSPESTSSPSKVLVMGPRT